MRASWGWRLAAACLLLAGFAGLAPNASAVVVHGHRGHFYGVTPHRGVSPAAIPGSVAAAHASRLAAQATSTSSSSDNGTLSYHNGPVMHSSSPYLIYWAPSGESIPSGWQSLFSQYFTDVAKDSTKASNVHAVARQFTDGSGFADYRQSFDPAQQVITDHNAYPTRDSICADSPLATCLSDAQLQAEIERLIAANGLPTDGASSATSLPKNAPIYFVVLPSDVNLCLNDGFGTSCATNSLCSYHGSFTDSGNNNILYSPVPTEPLSTQGNPKGCQTDGYSAVQAPNSSTSGIADVALKYLSHEDNETVTDPLGTGWYDSISGNENGDNCNQYAPAPANPGQSTSPNAFAPVLGGSSSGGTLYDQVMNSHQYYLQSEWSNGDLGCQMQPTSGTVTPQFTAPAAISPPGTSLSFDPTASTSTRGYSSVTWDWGDGSTTFSAGSAKPGVVQHSYAAAGTYAVTLTLVDTRGNLATVSHQVAVYSKPVAAFSFAPSKPAENTSVSFDGSGSSDPDHGVSITTYAWNFGDGSLPTSAGTPTTTHGYKTPGTYTAQLTVTNSQGLTSTTSQPVTVVDDSPTASFTSTPASASVNQSVAFSASATDPDGTISGYSWNFGDATGATPASPSATASHPYTATGVYTVTLTVTDSAGQTTTVTQQVTIGPIAAFRVSPQQPIQDALVTFDGTISNPLPGTSIQSYDWNFGDGSADGTGSSATHPYAKAGTYKVTLTVKNDQGQTDTATKSITVNPDVPTAAIGVNTSPAFAGYSVAFDGTGSSDPAKLTLSYLWDFGDGTSATGATPSHLYAAPGTYTVKLTVTNPADPNQSNTATQQLTVSRDVPTAAIVIGTAPAYVGNSISFDGTSSSDPAGSTLQYLWNFGDRSTSTSATPTHSFATAQQYTVSLTVTNGQGATSTTTKTVSVAPDPPVARFTVPTSLPLAGQPVAFDASGSSAVTGPIATYTWSFGDDPSSPATGVTAAHTFSGPGTYPVSLTVTDTNHQSATVTQLVTVHAPPSASFTVSSGPLLDHTAVTFNGDGSLNPDASTSISSYFWQFGDGATAFGPAASHAYAQPGRYVVQLTVTNGLGLTNTTKQTVTVADEPPTAAFALTTTRPAAGHAVGFKSSSSDPDGAVSAYRWSFGDGGTATGGAPSHTYAKPGTYTVSLTVTDSAGQTATTAQSVTVGLSGRITKVSVKPGRTGATLLVSVNTAGTLTAGRKTYQLRRAGTARVAIKLTAAQILTATRTHPLKIRVPLRFVPAAGPLSTTTASVTFRASRVNRGRLAAVLGR